MKKKILSILTALALCLSLMPATALAAGCETCVDEDGDYICDSCWETIEHQCVDADGDHYCDFCWEWMRDLCVDEDGDHACEICWSVMDWLCSDADSDHDCDNENCGNWLSACEDWDGDNVCDICEEGIYPHAGELNVDAVFGDGQATVTWNPVAEQVGEDALACYTVYIYDSDNQNFEDAEKVSFALDGCDFAHIFTGLINDVEYEVGVEAVYTFIKEGHDLPYSMDNSTSGIPISASATEPGMPEIQSISYGDGTITVTWTAPEDSGGAMVRRYEVHVDQESWGMTIGLDASDFDDGEIMSYTVDELTNGERYSIGVSAANAVGWGEVARTEAGAVDYMLQQGLMIGVGEGQFAPDLEMSRGMLVTTLWRLEGKPVVNYAMSFIDVPADSWYTEAVRWAMSLGIVSGYGNGAFGVEDTLTREQLASILWRYAKYKGKDVSVGEDTNILSYNDAFDISEYAIPAMQWTCGAGIINGKDGGILEPKGSATRAEAAQMLTRYLLNQDS